MPLVCNSYEMFWLWELTKSCVVCTAGRHGRFNKWNLQFCSLAVLIGCKCSFWKLNYIERFLKEARRAGRGRQEALAQFVTRVLGQRDVSRHSTAADLWSSPLTAVKKSHPWSERHGGIKKDWGIKAGRRMIKLSTFFFGLFKLPPL